MNVVYILSDQHNPCFTGCYGGITRTPHLDALASGGVRFNGAYTNYPICAPSRASLFTGRYVHETGFWDNATPYDGSLPNWARYFRDNGAMMAAVGKLDLREKRDHGIEVLKTVKLRHNIDITGLFRNGPPTTRLGHMKSHWAAMPRDHAKSAKAEQEETITREATEWIRTERPTDRPWVLNVNYFKPHPKWEPLPELYDHYTGKTTSLAARYTQGEEALNEVERAQSLWSCGYSGDENRIPEIHAAYHATVEEMDGHIGKIVEALDEAGLRDKTMILYTSDHGEMARAHGCWGKISLYEDSIRVPLIINGPGVSKGLVRKEPVSLIDVYPTICHALELQHASFARGRSLLPLAEGQQDSDRSDFVFSESQLNPRLGASFAVVHDGWKLIEVVGHEPMLFHLDDDPEELENLAGQSGSAVQSRLYELRRRLASICSPEAVDKRARADQRKRIEELADSGRLFREQASRGFEESTESLIPLKSENDDPPGP